MTYEMGLVHGDVGSSKELVLTAEVLESRGANVTHLVDESEISRAKKEVLDPMGIASVGANSVSGYKPDIIVVGTSTDAYSAQAFWTKFGNANHIPVIWVEDALGIGERKHVLKLCPDVICTIEKLAADTVRRYRPNVKVEIVRKPSFADFRIDIKPKYPIEDDIKIALEDMFSGGVLSRPIITYWSSGPDVDRIIEHLSYLKDLEIRIGVKCFIFLRLHPKLDEEGRKRAINFAKQTSRNIIVDSGFGLAELMRSSTINLIDWESSLAYVSAYYGRPTVLCMSQSQKDEEERYDACYEHGIPPLLYHKAGWGVVSQNGLIAMTRKILCDADGARAHTLSGAKAFSSLFKDGSAEKIADVIYKHLPHEKKSA